MENISESDFNIQEQKNELLVLESVFGDEEFETSTGTKVKILQLLSENSLQLNIKIDQIHILVLEFTLPENYPSKTHPNILFHASWLDNYIYDKIKKIELELIESFIPEEPILFSWIEKLLDQETFKKVYNYLIKNQVIQNTQEHTSNFKKINYLDIMKQNNFKVYKSDPNRVKDSKFIAHVVVNISSLDRINKFMSILLSDKNYAKATHSMYAYRIETDTYIDENRNDDGENGAGDVLLNVLKYFEAINVLIVVTRWFGGTLLGPKRFSIISDTSKTLLYKIPRKELQRKNFK